MNIYPSTYLNNFSSQETTNKWGMFKTWQDIVNTYGGRWWTLFTSYLNVFSKILIFDGNFVKNSTLSLPLPYSCYDANLFNKFQFYLYDKKIDYQHADNYIVFNKVEFRDDYSGRLIFYLASDVIPLTSLEKYTFRSLKLSDIKLKISLTPDLKGIYSFKLTSSITTSISADMFGVYNLNVNSTSITYIEAGFISVYTLPFNLHLTQTFLPLVRYNNVGKWYYYNSWLGMSNEWSQA